MIKSKILDILEIELKKDENIYEELEKIQKKLKIKNGFYNGIGAGKDLKVGFLYSTNPVKYKDKSLKGEYEITSFIGNIREGKYHTHITLSDEKFNFSGGHFHSGKVGFILQLYINVTEYYK